MSLVRSPGNYWKVGGDDPPAPEPGVKDTAITTNFGYGLGLRHFETMQARELKDLETSPDPWSFFSTFTFGASATSEYNYAPTGYVVDPTNTYIVFCSDRAPFARVANLADFTEISLNPAPTVATTGSGYNNVMTPVFSSTGAFLSFGGKIYSVPSFTEVTYTGAYGNAGAYGRSVFDETDETVYVTNGLNPYGFISRGEISGNSIDYTDGFIWQQNPSSKNCFCKTPDHQKLIVYNKDYSPVPDFGGHTGLSQFNLVDGTFDTALNAAFGGNLTQIRVLEVSPDGEYLLIGTQASLGGQVDIKLYELATSTFRFASPDHLITTSGWGVNQSLAYTFQRNGNRFISTHSYNSTSVKLKHYNTDDWSFIAETDEISGFVIPTNPTAYLSLHGIDLTESTITPMCPFRVSKPSSGLAGQLYVRINGVECTSSLTNITLNFFEDIVIEPYVRPDLETINPTAYATVRDNYGITAIAFHGETTISGVGFAVQHGDSYILPYRPIEINDPPHSIGLTITTV